ncbi:LacI family transcriptional regulator [Microcella alkaliphila]|uniref:LacI family transcriptional regulator n=1 Tax=Microcella alkaliphila TaxID=279828 RepID=A0A4Q7TB73_9MICO|nr:LacI family DNA-binding transcriptional regulator [Microcella alkaliphila]RZT57393.1 LacI family transcriptional regulator [Microcella alkaliphila]
MNRRVTIADVAAQAGVHKATVSRALNEATRDQVNIETLRRVQKAAKLLGYVPNAMARSLRTSQSMTVGVIIPDLTNPIFPPVIRGIENYLSPRGYTALLANTDSRDALEQSAVHSLSERQVDGFIIATGLEDHPLIPSMFERNIPAVMVNRGSGSIPYPLVTGNDAAGITAAIEHLRALGHREVVHLAGPSNYSTSRVRKESFTTACADAGLTGVVVDVPSLTAEDGERAVDDLLSRRRTFTAIQASNDLLALGALRSLRAHGLGCPTDVSVIGFNDMPFAEEFSPGLTTVHVPLQMIGTESARILLDTIETGHIRPIAVMLPVSLVIRGSSGPAAAVR